MYDSGGQLLVQVLREAGVEAVFGVLSVHNMPLVDAVDAHLRFVPVRHEATAVNAADGYARVRGGIGCAITSTGTGAGNAAGSLIEALTAGSPVLHVTGQVPLEYLGQRRGFMHETPDQLGMLRAVCKHAETLLTPLSATERLREAVSTAQTPPKGPITVEWPIDLQYAAHPTGLGVDDDVWHFHALESYEQVNAELDGQTLDQAARLLAAARRPLIWAGGGAVSARWTMSDLLEATSAGLFTSNAGRGVVTEDHPLCVGNFAATGEGRALLAEGDVLLSIGTHFRSNETADYTLELPGNHIQVDVDAAALGRVYPATVSLRGDARHVVSQLLDRIRHTGNATEHGWPTRVRKTREAVRAQLRADIGPHATICDAIHAVFPRDSVIARDITIASSAWGNRLLPIYDPSTNVFARGGGIGQGLGMGIGAAIARAEVPTLVIVGDGGLAVHLGELYTLAQEQPWLTLLVFNDGGYGVLRNTQDAHVGRRFAVDLHTPDFALLAASAGIPYQRITDVTEVEKTLAQAVEHRGPVLVEVDVAAIGDMPRPFTPPVEVPT